MAPVQIKGRGPRASMKGAEVFSIDGVNETIANLHKINKSVARPSVVAGMRAGMKVIAKAIRAEIKHPSVRATIAHRFKRGRGQDHRIFAKVGGSVGRKGNTHNPRYGRTPGRSWPGKHMSKQNVHWYLIGTKDRIQHSTGRRTGKMWGSTPQPQPVRTGYAKSSGIAVRTAVNQMQKTFIKKMKQRIKVRGLRAALP